jgi:uncharacterized Zn finger protein
MARWWPDYPVFEPSRPRPIAGGIRAQSKRGRFAERWWGERWIAVLESFNLGGRLTRGRSYARSGQVFSLEFDKSVVRARVQGSRPKPYDVTIKVRPLSPREWARVIRDLGERAVFAGRLLAGEMPREIEEVFSRSGLSLFPAADKELGTACSCPDWSNPCKHIAAVYYLLGEEFDRDPFLLFGLRGLSREELVARLTGTRPEASGEAGPGRPSVALDPGRFWQVGDVPADFFGEVRTPPLAAALPKQLGKFPLWRGQQPLAALLEPIYDGASRRGLSVFLGEASGLIQRSPEKRPKSASVE